MDVQLQLVITTKSGEQHVETVAHFHREELRLDSLGITLAEAKSLLENVQKG